MAERREWLKRSRSASVDFTQFGDWEERFSKVGDGKQSDLIKEGVQLAKARRVALFKLMKNDPSRALELIAPRSRLKTLPPEIQQEMESHFSGKADYAIEHACSMGNPRLEDRTDHLLKIGQTWVPAVIDPSRPVRNRSKKGISAHGILLNGVAFVNSSPARFLTMSEIEEAGLDPARVHVEILGIIHTYDSPADADAVIEKLLVDENSPISSGATYPTLEGTAMTPQAAATTTTYSVLYIRARFNDEASTYDPLAIATAQSNQNAVRDFYMNATYGTVTLNTTFVTPVVMLTSNASAYKSILSALILSAQNAARTAGWDSDAYDFTIVVTSNKAGFSYAGSSSPANGACHLRNDYATMRTAAHEIGHLFDLAHAYYWQTDSTSPNGKDSSPGGYVSDGREAIEYGHRYSIMGGQAGSSGFDDPKKPHFTSFEKLSAGWLQEADIFRVNSGSGVYRLNRLDHRNAIGKRGLIIDLPSSDYTGNMQYRYWLSYRNAFDTGVPGTYSPYGLEVDISSGFASVQLDMTPYTRDSGGGQDFISDNSDKEDGQLPIGRTFSDPAAGIHFTPLLQGNPDGLANSGDEWIDVDVRIGTFPENRPPSAQLAASQLNIAVNQEVTFTTSTSDPDGDTLSYWWDFGDNSLVVSSLNQPTAKKSWGTAGQYVVRCIVSDRKGGQTIRQTLITVGGAVGGQIYGLAHQGGVPLPLTRVTGGGRSTWTDSDGHYILASLPTATHTLNANRDTLSVAPQFTNPVTTTTTSKLFGYDFVASGETLNNQPFGRLSISGTITSVGLPLAGVVVTAGDYTTSTSATGSYTLSNLLPGVYTVTPSHPIWKFSVPSSELMISTSSVNGINFQVATSPVEGELIGLPTNLSPAPQVQLSSGQTTTAVLSGTQWFYDFPAVPLANVHVSASANGYVLKPRFVNPLLLRQNSYSSTDFQATLGNDNRLASGRVTLGINGLSGVSLSVKTGTTTVQTSSSDTDGQIRLQNLGTATYTVTPSKTGYTFNPASITFAAPTTALNFSAISEQSETTIQSITATPATAGQSFTLSALATGPSPLSYQWWVSNNEGPAIFIPNRSPTAATTTVSSVLPGTYRFQLQVTDGLARKAIATQEVTVASGPPRLLVSPSFVEMTAGRPSPFPNIPTLMVSNEDKWISQMQNRLGLMVSVKAKPTGPEVDASGLIIISGTEIAAREALQTHAANIRAMLHKGGTLFVYGLDPDGAKWLSGLADSEMAVEAFGAAGAMLEGASPLVAGLGHGDFFPAGIGDGFDVSQPLKMADNSLSHARISGPAVRPLTRPINLAEIPVGQGRIIVFLIRSLEHPVPPMVRILSTVLSNAGAPLDPGGAEKDDTKWTFHPIDLAPFLNWPLVDNDRPGQRRGWHLGGAENDMREFPKGPQNLRGVDYVFSDPAQTNGNGVIGLSGANPKIPALPREIKGIPINQKAERLYFLHNSAWGVPQFVYRVYYLEDRKAWIPGKPDPYVDVLVKPGENNQDWWFGSAVDKGAKFLPGATVAWLGDNAATRRANTQVGVYQMAWDNPHPEKTIESVDILSTGHPGDGNAYIFGITAANRSLEEASKPPLEKVLPKGVKATDVFEQIQFKRYGAVLLKDGTLACIYDNQGRPFAEMRGWAVQSSLNRPGQPPQHNELGRQSGQPCATTCRTDGARRIYEITGDAKTSNPLDWHARLIATPGSLRYELDYTPLVAPKESDREARVHLGLGMVAEAKADNRKPNENPVCIETPAGLATLAFDSRYASWFRSYAVQPSGITFYSPPATSPPYMIGQREIIWWELAVP